MISMSDETVSYMGTVKRILKGTAIALGITIILLFILSLLLTYTSLSESTIPIIVIIITGISILIGSELSTQHIKRNGIINGMAVGLIYIAVIYLISSIIGGNFGLTLYSIIMIIVSLVTRSNRRNHRGQHA